MICRIDLFCNVIDNLGDIGVCWRLARQLTHEHNCQVRLWVDQIDALKKLEPCVNSTLLTQRVQAVDVWRWNEETVHLDSRPLPDMVIAAFSCELPQNYLQRLAEQRKPDNKGQSGSLSSWIQLEYLSAEPWVDEFHLQRSLRADGLSPVYFFPGFRARTGGLIRERSITFNTTNTDRSWLADLGVSTAINTSQRIISVFTYPDAPLDQFVHQLEQLGASSLLLVPDGVQTSLDNLDSNHFIHVKWQKIPFLRQVDYDRLLACCDLNLVRGEDSFVRAIWAGNPFVWHIYRQQEREHHVKLQAWLDRARLPEAVGDIMHKWSDGIADHVWQTVLSKPQWQSWRQACSEHRQELLRQDSLSLQLLRIGCEDN